MALRNGALRNTVYGAIAALILGLGAWTVKGVRDLTVTVTKIERDEAWIIKILSAQRNKNFQPPEKDE